MKKLKTKLILIRFWLWAATHSPRFSEFEISLDPAPITLSIVHLVDDSDLLTIQLSLNKPKLWIYYPWSVFVQFLNSKKDAGEIIDPSIFNNIPF
ncbi:hypothetical protein VF14_11535 [Nostoc linckia z18]|uniref:Uncharacterized protein n=2 Tax=Nostoc linckia TaxID=92942 RepID=A0A9Q5Z9Z4_NOSLI|nr:hypothetical protein [Nostoc linckia]MBL1199122.1 hypothetical protein [Nostoc sp. GBBB01]PHK40913.1 hypothetical protein VF12_08715 [Nostoc linckia z15]PHK46456.1 hypothetical protein VF13_10950 [Nostoc linckia z16]PHJ60256.1 hypothetical protein VF02_23105 [Nostoc linckia z1]PHJ63822.1 hypothetical protein VF05_24070 [Nostoc linckia z3]